MARPFKEKNFFIASSLKNYETLIYPLVWKKSREEEGGGGGQLVFSIYYDINLQEKINNNLLLYL